MNEADLLPTNSVYNIEVIGEPEEDFRIVITATNENTSVLEADYDSLLQIDIGFKHVIPVDFGISLSFQGPNYLRMGMEAGFRKVFCVDEIVEGEEKEIVFLCENSLEERFEVVGSINSLNSLKIVISRVNDLF